jgi:hypothetical protein
MSGSAQTGGSRSDLLPKSILPVAGAQSTNGVGMSGSAQTERLSQFFAQKNAGSAPARVRPGSDPGCTVRACQAERLTPRCGLADGGKTEAPALPRKAATAAEIQGQLSRHACQAERPSQ